MNELINYGFSTISHKLSWGDIIHMLNLAFKSQHPKFKELMEMTMFSF